MFQLGTSVAQPPPRVALTDSPERDGARTYRQRHADIDAREPPHNRHPLRGIAAPVISPPAPSNGGSATDLPSRRPAPQEFACRSEGSPLLLASALGRRHFVSASRVGSLRTKCDSEWLSRTAPRTCDCFSSSRRRPRVKKSLREEDTLCESSPAFRGGATSGPGRATVPEPQSLPVPADAISTAGSFWRHVYHRDPSYTTSECPCLTRQESAGASASAMASMHP